MNKIVVLDLRCFLDKSFIITGYVQGDLQKILEKECMDFKQKSFIIGVDRGYEIAIKSGILPDVAIGDFDSITATKDCEKNHNTKEWITYPSEKDDTDTLLAVTYALEKGVKDISIIGGMGGRLDHTLANIQAMAFVKDYFQKNQIKNSKITMVDEKNWCILIENEEIILYNERGKYVSLISLSDEVLNINSENLKWTLSGKTLKNTYPLGISNEIIGEKAKISVGEGKLLVIVSRD